MKINSFLNSWDQKLNEIDVGHQYLKKGALRTHNQKKIMKYVAGGCPLFSVFDIVLCSLMSMCDDRQREVQRQSKGMQKQFFRFWRMRWVWEQEKMNALFADLFGFFLVLV